MSRIQSKALTTNMFKPELVFYDENVQVITTVPLETLQHLASTEGPDAAKAHVITTLESVLGELTPEEREFALRP